MKNKALKTIGFLLVLMLFLVRFETISQELPQRTTYSLEKFEMQTFKLHKDEENSKISGLKKHEVLISFTEGFSDTILIFVNDSLLLKTYVLSDTLGRGYSNTSFKLNFKSFQKRKLELTFVIPDKEKYVTFKLKPRYKMLKVHRLDSKWQLIRSNYVPEYQ